MLESMENSGFEVHDVEGWRDHYAKDLRTLDPPTRGKPRRSHRQIGEERYRMWLFYLAGVSLALGDGHGGACIFQTVATRHIKKGLSGMPPTREHLYRPRDDRSARAAEPARKPRVPSHSRRHGRRGFHPLLCRFFQRTTSFSSSSFGRVVK